MKYILILLVIILFASCSPKKKFNTKSIQLNNEAVEKVKTQDYTSALNLLNQSIKLDSSYYLAYVNEVSILVDLKRYNEAIVTNKLLLRHKPDLAEGRFSLGMLYDIAGDTISAKQSYMEAIQLYQDRIAEGKMI